MQTFNCNQIGNGEKTQTLWKLISNLVRKCWVLFISNKFPLLVLELILNNWPVLVLEVELGFLDLDVAVLSLSEDNGNASVKIIGLIKIN